MKKLIPILVLIAAAAFAATYDTPGISGGGGGTTWNAPIAFASIPACSTSVFFQPLSNSLLDYAYCDGASALTYYYGGRVVQPVVDGDYSWDNQDTATATATYGHYVLTSPGNAGTEVFVRYKSATPPFTWTVGLMSWGTDSNCQAVALVGESSSGKWVTMERTRGGVQAILLWDSAISYSGTSYLGTPTYGDGNILWWARIVDDGTTNRTYSISHDGQTWLQVLSHARTTGLTANRVGIGMRPTGSNTCNAYFVSAELD